jgi:RNA-directed DNA polymerase
MKSCKVRLEEIAAPENLREAFLRAARGKAHRADVISFRAHLDAELAALAAEILGGGVRVGEFTAFTIHEPKERRIHAPCFRERVLYHARVGPCEADFERWHIADTYACRRDRGREAARRRAEHFAARHGWFLKLDVEKYFDSIPHATLLADVARRFRDARVVALWRRIVESYATAPGRGLPIGALTSQHLANLYLARVDRLAKETLRVSGYVRYMDDMALWGERDALKSARVEIETLLRDELGLRLKPMWHLQPTACGMEFLGYRVFPHGSQLARPSRRRFLRRWLWGERALERGQIDGASAQRRALALCAFVRVARRERVLETLFGPPSGGPESDHGHRAPTASTAAAVGIIPPPTAAPRIATGIRRATATTTSASASPSAHATRLEKSPD